MQVVNLSEGWSPEEKLQHSKPLQVVNLSEGWVPPLGSKKGCREDSLCVDPPGFEPRQTEPKSVVLPLHHGSVIYLGLQRYTFFYFLQKILENGEFKELLANKMKEQNPKSKPNGTS